MSIATATKKAPALPFDTQGAIPGPAARGSDRPAKNGSTPGEGRDWAVYDASHHGQDAHIGGGEWPRARPGTVAGLVRATCPVNLTASPGPGRAPYGPRPRARSHR
ncbi:hypothetical protein GCM10027176_60030 [Actinoallomurus bryophytorum]